MQNQKEKLLRWILRGGILFTALIIPELIIVKLIFMNNLQAVELYSAIMAYSTMLIYLFISLIKLIKYKRDEKNIDKEK